MVDDRPTADKYARPHTNPLIPPEETAKDTGRNRLNPQPISYFDPLF